MKLSKANAQKLSGLINSLLVWQAIASEDIAKEKVAGADLAMRAYNEAADELIAAGIHVNKYLGMKESK